MEEREKVEKLKKKDLRMRIKSNRDGTDERQIQILKKVIISYILVTYKEREREREREK